MGDVSNDEERSDWARRLPNLLSALRLALAVLFPVLGASWRLPAVLLAAFTDWSDGFLARRWKVQSMTGALLDAIADKGFALSVMLTLAVQGDIRLWQIALVLPRDLVVMFVSAYVAARGRWMAFTDMRARILGRTTTVFVFGWFLTLVTPGAEALRLPALVLTAIASLAAAVEYAVRFVRAVHEPALEKTRTSR